MTDNRILKALGIAKAAYPQWKPVEGTEQTWALLLKDMDDETLFQSLIAHCQSSKWPPSIAELRDMAGVDELGDEDRDSIHKRADWLAGVQTNSYSTIAERQKRERAYDRAYDKTEATVKQIRAMERCAPLVEILRPMLGLVDQPKKLEAGLHGLGHTATGEGL